MLRQHLHSLNLYATVVCFSFLLAIRSVAKGFSSGMQIARPHPTAQEPEPSGAAAAHNPVWMWGAFMMLCFQQGCFTHLHA